MASLIEQELAARDAQLGRSPVSSGARTYLPPALRVRQQAITQRQQHDDELAAAREAMLQQKAANDRANLERKAESSDWHRGVAEENLKRLEAANATAQKIREAKEKLVEEEQRTKADRTLAILNDAIGFQRDARGMDPSSPKFDEQLQNLYAGYPLAGEHPSVQSWQKYHLPLREKYVAAEIAKKAEADKAATERVGLQQTYAKTLGHLSDLYEQRKANPKDAEVAGKIAGYEETIRSLESQNPGLRATRKLPGEPVVAPKGSPNLPSGLSPVPTTLVPDAAAPAASAPAEVPTSTLTGVDAPAVANPNLGVDDSASQEPAPTAVAETAAPAEVPAFSPVSSASFPPDSDFYSRKADSGDFAENQPSGWISHPVPGIPEAVGTMDIGNGALKPFDKNGKYVGPPTLYKADPETVSLRKEAEDKYMQIHSNADAAIKAGADPEAVKARLVQLGGHPARLTYDD